MCVLSMCVCVAEHVCGVVRVCVCGKFGYECVGVGVGVCLCTDLCMMYRYAMHTHIQYTCVYMYTCVNVCRCKYMCV